MLGADRRRADGFDLSVRVGQLRRADMFRQPVVQIFAARHAATICSRAFAVCNQAGCPKFRYSVMLLCFNRSARGWSFGYGGGARFNAGAPCPSPPSSSWQRCRPRPWGHQEVRKSTNTITGGGQPDPVRRVDRKHDLGDMTCVGFRVVDTCPVGTALGAEAVIGEPEPTVRDAVDATARPRVRQRAGAGHAGMLDPAEAAAVPVGAQRLRDALAGKISLNAQGDGDGDGDGDGCR